MPKSFNEKGVLNPGTYSVSFLEAQLPMWWFYRVELYPHLNQGTGIVDKLGYDLKFPSAFRQSRNEFEPKGIVHIAQGERT